MHLHIGVPARSALAIAWLFAFGCGGSDTSNAAGSGGSPSASSTAVTGPGVGGGPGAGGQAAGGAGAGGAGGAFVPTPAEIQFQAENTLPTGEQLLYNDWNPSPNVVYSLTLDGVTRTEIFRAFRVWSMGVAHAVDRIAFACGDPMQQAHYGLTLGDAIQNTWMYDVNAQTATLVADGNINDECHTFSSNDAHLYVCRRYDFMPDDTNKGWRVGRIDLATNAFEFLTPDIATEYQLNAQPTADETKLYFEAIDLMGASQNHEIRSMPLPSGAASPVRTNAEAPSLSPDGLRYTYNDDANGGALYVADLDGANAVEIVDHRVDTVRWSPDAQRVAFLDFDDATNCAHIEIAHVDGSDLGSPQRIRDCGMSGEFITELAWIVR